MIIPYTRDPIQLYHPHFDDPQSLQIRQPSSYTRFSEPHSPHLPFAFVPFGMYFFNALSTPFFQLLIDSLSSFNEVTRLTTCLLYTSDAADDLTRVDLGG